MIEPPAINVDTSAWRQEVSARLNRYQSRRKPRPPRYPSLKLQFEPVQSCSSLELRSASDFTSSHQALALDRPEENFGIIPAVPASPPPPPRPSNERPPVSAAAPQFVPQPRSSGATATAKIIEFPRSWTPPPVPLDQLAEPVLDRPRILEVPDIEPPPPALGGITIEPAKQPEVERRPGIDLPLHSAPLGRRIFAAAVDAVVVAASCALFGSIFAKIVWGGSAAWQMEQIKAAIWAPRLEILGVAAGLAALFWAASQYLLMVYSASTPGIRLAGLELCRFDGTSAGRPLRRWRVLASFLSAVSLGMGYIWVFLDEDALCWHDRITHTYLAAKARRNKSPQ